ncbi:MAG TPA: hypothetical protein VE868_10120 [Balneolaceae bacterium]|nr:hypothetical protein [Balneolaceae bacterium]
MGNIISLIEAERLNANQKTKINKEGYGGFTITAVKKLWKRFKVTAKNGKGRTVTATGNSLEEAYQEIVENINNIVREPWEN